MKIILFIVAAVLAFVAYNQFKASDPSLSTWDRIKAAAVATFTSIGAAVTGWFS